mmetsp:Transcript_15120/g.32865  ORF Transcript_15120/g.32865 Transcript_15120/m.32865 type:complete len:277 (+) Transcript_15120:122-952(+)
MYRTPRRHGIQTCYPAEGGVAETQSTVGHAARSSCGEVEIERPSAPSAPRKSEWWRKWALPPRARSECASASRAGLFSPTTKPPEKKTRRCALAPSGAAYARASVAAACATSASRAAAMSSSRGRESAFMLAETSLPNDAAVSVGGSPSSTQWLPPYTSLTSLSTSAALPRLARSSALLKSVALGMSSRARPRKVAPPHAVPPSRSYITSPVIAWTPSRRSTLTPEPMFTSSSGKSGSGQADGSSSPPPSTLYTSPGGASACITSSPSRSASNSPT